MTDLIEVKTARLIGAPLDWAVAMASGAQEMKAKGNGFSCSYELPEGWCWTNQYEPSTDWSQGGPLFDKHQGSAHHNPHLGDSSCSYSAGPAGAGIWLYGPTSLIAFCRTLVMTKLGDTVQVPKELMP